MADDYSVNVFYLHINPTLAAEALCDTHVRTLAPVLTQFLANAYFMEGAKLPPPEGYKAELFGHPCATWTTEDFKHWNWVLMNAWGVAREFQSRFGAESPVIPALRYMNKNLPLAWISQKNFWDPPRVMPAEFKASRVSGSMASYRAFYRGGLKKLHSWTKRRPPLWLLELSRAEELTSALVDAVELTLAGLDKLRTKGTSADEWARLTEAATDLINGRESEYDERVEALVDAADVVLVDPDGHRPKGLSDAEWAVVKFLAHERVNGRDPLAEPKDWDYTNYQGD